jgi:hypothetical protein
LGKEHETPLCLHTSNSESALGGASGSPDAMPFSAGAGNLRSD